jgi:alkylhydroperoxidase/carboxymuconolactone decarboxylase family protein YurZ
MSNLPKRFTDFVAEYPEVGKAYNALGSATSSAGPLDTKTRELVKIGIAISAGLEGGTHSHVRKALETGAARAEIRHVALLCISTIGFPAAMKGLSWIDDVIGEEI